MFVEDGSSSLYLAGHLARGNLLVRKTSVCACIHVIELYGSILVKLYCKSRGDREGERGRNKTGGGGEGAESLG